MQVGELRTPIEVQQQVETGRTSLNEPIVTWQKFCDAWADMYSRRGNEFFTAESQQRYSEGFWVFECRYLEVEGVKASMRIIAEGQTFEITGLRPGVKRRDCTAIDAIIQNETA